MKAIILAAGCGSRIDPAINDNPKCFLTINNETLLERLINQLIENDFDSITVVIGYKKEIFYNIIGSRYNNIKFVVNDEYDNDVNILSLTLALRQDLTPCYLFEADCIFEDECFNLILDTSLENKSFWFSKGMFKQNQNGGIIKANNNGEIVDIKIVDNYIDRYKDYYKMIGLFKIGENELRKYFTFLIKASKNSINQYYHLPWINNMKVLKSYLVDFGNLKVASINTLDDYNNAKELFINETG